VRASSPQWGERPVVSLGEDFGATVPGAVTVRLGQTAPAGAPAAVWAAAMTTPRPRPSRSRTRCGHQHTEMGSSTILVPGVICCRRGTAEITAAVGRCLNRPVPPTRPRRHTQMWPPYRARGADDLAQRRHGDDHYQYLGRLPGSRGLTHIIDPTSHGLAVASSQRGEREKGRRLQIVIFRSTLAPCPKDDQDWRCHVIQNGR